MTNEISTLRKKIDEIDDQTATLLAQRVEISLKIIEIKKRSLSKIEDVSRENSIIKRLCDNNPMIEELLKDVYRRVFDWVKNR
jgi:chorismate mutase